MEKETLQAWLTTVALELSVEAVNKGVKGEHHFDVYDDAGHGRVCSFEICKGKVIWWAWTEAVDFAEWPLGLLLTSVDGVTLKLWVGPRDWHKAA